MAIDKKDIKELVVEEYAKAIAEASSLDKIVYDLVTQTTSPTKEKLNEDNAATFPFRIFCDMDGVLVDLIQGIIDEANIRMVDKSERQRKSFMKILSSGEEWQNLKTSKQGKEVLKNIFKILGNDRDFWASLPLMSDANKLWGFINRFDPFILSHPWDGASAEGKRIWLSEMAKNISPAPPQTRIILTGDKHKYAVNKETGAPNLLIDDMSKYLGPWESAGGIAIKHISADSTIRQLKAIMEKENKGS
jgi:5'(3')-deoxyribonucleotidase